MSRNNPLTQALALIIAVVLLGLAFVVGAVLLGMLLAIGAVAAIAIAGRTWWLQRKIRSAAVRYTPGPSARQAIEGDYTVVDASDAKGQPPRSISRDDARHRPRDSAG